MEKNFSDPYESYTQNELLNKASLNKLNRQELSFHNEIFVLMLQISILSTKSFIQLYFYFKALFMLTTLALFLILQTSSKCYEGFNSIESLYITQQFISVAQFFILTIFLHIADRRVSNI